MNMNLIWLRLTAILILATSFFGSIGHSTQALDTVNTAPVAVREFALSPELRAACRSISRRIAPRDRDNRFYWQFTMNFNESGNGCFEIMERGKRKPVYAALVSCQPVGDIRTVAMEAPLRSALRRNVTPTLRVTTFGPAAYYECDFRFREYVEAARPVLGDVAQTVYEYSFFSMEALTALTGPQQRYSGAVVRYLPDPNLCNTSGELACAVTGLLSASDAPNQIRLNTVLNGATYVSPGFDFDPTLPQEWRVVLQTHTHGWTSKDQYALDVQLDQVLPADNGFVKHAATTFSKYFDQPLPGVPLRFFGGNGKILIGGGPGSDSFNGGLIQIMLDPGGASGPDSAG
jgi:hypothetical protein